MSPLFAYQETGMKKLIFFFGHRCDCQEAKVIMGFWLKMESTNQILLSGLTLFFFLCIVLIFRNEVYLPYLQVNNSLLIF